MLLARPLFLASLSTSAAFAADPAVLGFRAEAAGDAETISVAVSYDPSAVVTSLEIAVSDDVSDLEVEAKQTGAIVHVASTLDAGVSPESTWNLTLLDAKGSTVGTVSGRSFRDRDRTSTGTEDLLVVGMFFATGAKTNGFSIDLGGAAALDVARASLSVTAPKSDEIDVYPVSILGKETVWSATLDRRLEGETTLKAIARDEKGKRVERGKGFADPGWSGPNDEATVAQPVDTGTSLALIEGDEAWGLVVVSDGWFAGSDLPEVATLEVDGGDDIDVALHSYQRTAAVATVALGDGKEEACADEFFFEIDGTKASFFKEISTKNKKRYVNADLLIDLTCTGPGKADIAVTAIRGSVDALPSSVALGITSRSGKFNLKEAVKLSFAKDFAVVFASTVGFAENPVGTALDGVVRLEGAAKKRGGRPTLAKGKVSALFVRDAEGEVGLGASAREVSPRGDILIGGEPIDIERTGPGGEVLPPPAIVLNNGSGTRPVATTNNGKPGLL
jgi:hypothetical protein